MKQTELPQVLEGLPFSLEKAHAGVKQLLKDDGWLVIKQYLTNTMMDLTKRLTHKSFEEKPDYYRGELYALMQMIETPDRLLKFMEEHYRIKESTRKVERVDG